MLRIHYHADGVTFAVKIRPRGQNNAIAGEVGDAFKLFLTTPPVDGRANEACLEFLRKTFEGAAIFLYHCVRPDQPE